MTRPDQTCLRALEDAVLAAKIQLLGERLARVVEPTFLVRLAPCAAAPPETPLRRRFRVEAEADVKSETRRARLRPATRDR